jgi:antirestriction protein ArdC
MLCAELGITQTVRPDHAQYLMHWVALLRDDDRAIFTAAARASEAVNYLNSLQPHEPDPTPIPRAEVSEVVLQGAGP